MLCECVSVCGVVVKQIIVATSFLLSSFDIITLSDSVRCTKKKGKVFFLFYTHMRFKAVRVINNRLTVVLWHLFSHTTGRMSTA